MNAYNSEAYVEQTIKSILNQTERDIRLVIRNNGSTDATGEICQKWAKKDKRIQYLYNHTNMQTDEGIGFPKRGWWPAFNSEYVSMMDSDDLLDKSFAREMYQAAKKMNADMVVCGTTMFQDGSKRILNQRIPPELWTKDMSKLQEAFPALYGSLRPVWGKIFRLGFFEQYYDFAWDKPDWMFNGLDTFTVLGYLMNCRTFVSLGKALHFYRVRQQSAFFTAKLQPERIKAGEVLYARGQQCLNQLNIATSENNSFLNAVYWGHLCDLLSLLDSSNQMNGQEKIAYLDKILKAPLSQRILLNDGNFSPVFQRLAQSISVVEEQNDNELYVTAKEHFLQRLKAVHDQKAQSNPDLLLFITYLSALADPANPHHWGKVWLHEKEWGYLPSYAQDFLRLSSRQQTEALDDREQLKTILRQASSVEQINQLEEELVTHMEHQAYDAAIDSLNELTKQDPLNKAAFYFRTYLAYLINDDQTALQLGTIAKIFWEADDDINQICADIMAQLQLKAGENP